jgi:hypothetical protein
MDLASLEPKAGATITLRHPVTGEPVTDESDGKPVTIDIVGIDSPQFQARRRSIANKRLTTSGNRRAKLTAEDIEDEGIATLAACVTGWSANLEFDGKPLDFSRSNARLLLTRLVWVREQLDEAMADRANFLPASPTS